MDFSKDKEYWSIEPITTTTTTTSTITGYQPTATNARFSTTVADFTPRIYPINPSPISSNTIATNTQNTLYPNLATSTLLPTLTPAVTNTLPTINEKKIPSTELASIMTNILGIILTVEQRCEKEEEIQKYIQANSQLPWGKIIHDLFDRQLISRSVLMHLVMTKHKIADDSDIKTWWKNEKTTIASQYNSQYAPLTAKEQQALPAQLDYFISNCHYQRNLVEELQTGITQFARENFYTYKSGNTYYYSPKPDEEGIGGRCDSKGMPLKDELGNDLTDQFGNFRHEISQIVLKPDDDFEFVKREVPAETPDATPYTDKNGVSLANKYRQMIANEKPKNISKQRSQAVNHLFQLIDTASAHDIFEYIMTPSFQRLIGTEETNFVFWKTSLAQVCGKFTSTYQKLSDQLTDKTLLNILMDEQIYRKISKENLAKLFWNYNSSLVADIIVNLYQDTTCTFEGVNFTFLQNLLKSDKDALEKLNEEKCLLKASLLLPPDVRLPGKNTLEDENLSKEQLFQYDDITIAAIEQHLRTSFKTLIINSTQEFEVCDFFLMFQWNGKEINQKIKNQAMTRAMEMPVLILMKESNKFKIYGDPNANGNLELSEEIDCEDLVNTLLHKKGIIKRGDLLFTPQLIEILKRGHAEFGKVDTGRLSFSASAMMQQNVPYWFYQIPTNAYMLMEPDDEYSRILMLNSEPSQQNPLPPGVIGLLQKNGNLIAYWSGNRSKSLQIDIDPDIKSILEDPAELQQESTDENLIGKISLKYGCNNPNYFRFKKFMQDIRSLVNDPDIGHYTKPIIFFGIINIEGTHYLPYFIYRKDNLISVITVDSSPAVYPSNVLDKAHIDSKEETYKKVANIFQAIFPGCQVYDPKVTQMLRERDCGPNAAQTNFEALLFSTTENPLIFIDAQGALHINPKRLSSSSQPIGLNPYTKTYVYPAEIETKTNTNRTIWGANLRNQKDIYYIFRPNWLANLPVRVTDTHQLIREVYDYTHQVDTQILQDERNTNISAIQSILLSDENSKPLVDTIISHYKTTLKIGDLTPLANFIKSKTDSLQLEGYTSTHQNNLMLLLEDVAAVLLKEFIPEALATALQTQMLAKLPDHTNLTADAIVTSFLNDHQTIYKKLAPYDQMRLKNSLKGKAEEAVKIKLIEVYTSICKDLFERNGFTYLRSIRTVYSAPDVSAISECLLREIGLLHEIGDSAFFKDSKYGAPAIQKAFQFVKVNDPAGLSNLVQQQVFAITRQALINTLDYAKKKFSFATKSLQKILEHITHQNGFVPPNPNEYLPAKQEATNALTCSEEDLNSALGSWLIPKINDAFYDELNKIIGIKVKEHVQKFIKQAPFRKTLVDDQSLQIIDSWFDENDQLIASFDFSQFLTQYGKAETLVLSDYSHPFSRRYIQDQLIKELAYYANKARYDEFVLISNSILETVKSKITVELICFYDITELTNRILSEAISSSQSLRETFNENFFDSGTDQYNQYGIRFATYFHQTCMQKILVNYQQGLQTKAMTEATLLLLNDLDKPENSHIFEILKKYRETLNKLLVSLNLTSCSETIDFTIRDFELKKIQQAIANELISQARYIKGDVTPGSVATMLRPIACSLLGIPASQVLIARNAKVVDDLIVARCKEENPTFTLQKPALLTIEPVNSLPVTYNRRLTPSLLVDLLSYWYSNYRTIDNMKFMMDKEGLPPIILQMIEIINSSTNLKEPLNGGQIQSLQDVMKTDTHRNELKLFCEQDATSQIMNALRKSGMAGELQPSQLTFGLLSNLLRNEDVSAELKKATGKPVISQEQFNGLVQQKYVERLEIAQATAVSTSNMATSSSQSLALQPPALVSIQAIRDELLEKYKVDGLEKTEKQVVSAGEFNSLVTKAIQSCRTNKQQINLPEIRNELKKSYTIGDTEKAPDVNIVPRDYLQRQGFNKFHFFGDTGLDHCISYLQASPHAVNDDRLDSWDIEQLRLLLLERWNRLCKKYKNDSSQAAVNHYLKENPNYRDSEYIVIAGLLVQHYRKQNIDYCKYELLMPGFFPPSVTLKTKKLPEAIVNKYSQVAKNGQLYDIKDNVSQKLDIEETSIDDIPLKSLVITKTGYAFSIDWIIQEYEKTRKLINPYSAKKCDLFLMLQETGQEIQENTLTQAMTMAQEKNTPVLVFIKESLQIKIYGDQNGDRNWKAYDPKVLTSVTSEDIMKKLPFKDGIMKHDILDTTWIIALKKAHFFEKELVESELDAILTHPQGRELVKKVEDYCIPHITPKVIDILEEYVNGTVFYSGYTGYYGPVEDSQKEAAIQKFWIEIGKLPKAQVKALMEEKIPNMWGETVGDCVSPKTTKGPVDCITTTSTSCARVVYAYKGDSHKLKDFILHKISSQSIARKEFVGTTKTGNASVGEKYILQKMHGPNSSQATKISNH